MKFEEVPGIVVEMIIRIPPIEEATTPNFAQLLFFS